MVDYSTLLTTWGDSGAAYPGGYSYLEGEQPVDAWDNFLIYNVIEDLSSLISTTNSRIETAKGLAGGEPASPEISHLYHDQDNEVLKVWDSTTAAWREVAFSDDLTLGGALDAAGYGISNVGALTMAGLLDVNGNNVTDGATVIYDTATGQFSDADTVDGQHATDLGSGASDSGTLVLNTATDFNFASNLDVTDDGDGTVTIDAQVPDADLTDVSEDGVQIAPNATDINFTGILNVTDDLDGSVSIDASHNHDSRYSLDTHSHALGDLSNVTASGEGAGNGFDADTVDGNHASAFATAGHLHDSRYLLESDYNPYTDENAQDAVGGILSSEFIYDDASNSISLDASVTDSYSNENAQDAVGNIMTGSGATSVNYDDGSNTIKISSTDTDTRYYAGNALTKSGNTFDVNEGAINADMVDGNHASAFASSGHTHDGRYYTESEVDSRTYSDEQARDAVGVMTTGSGATTVTYDDSGNTLTIHSTDTNTDTDTTYSAGNALSLSGTQFNVIESAINADQVDGYHASAFASSGHTHDGRYARLYDGVQAPVYTSTSNVPSGITKGEIVYIDGDGLYVEDGT
jgi:hypothetical protein